MRKNLGGTSWRSRSVGQDSVDLVDALVQSGLSPAIANAIDDLPQRNIEVDPRRPFREPGLAGDEIFFVRSGILAKFKPEPNGRRQILALRFAGEGVWPSEPPPRYGLQAIVKSQVVVMQKADLETVVDDHPELAAFILKAAQRHEAINHEWLVNCGIRNATARVAHLLCETATRSGIAPSEKRFPNPFTQQQIADITGQTSINVNRVLADLERQGLIRREARDIVVNDWAELRRVGEFRPNYLL